MKFECVASDALEWMETKPDNCLDLIVTSPPYSDRRSYGIKADRRTVAWVEWLRPIVVEMCRVSRLVALNVSDGVRKFRYGAGDIFLINDLLRLDGLQLGPAPYAWCRTGVAGSGGPRYQRRNWEPVYVLARPCNLPPIWSDNTAFGAPPKFGPGGEMSHRVQDGRRVNVVREMSPGRKHGRERQGYRPPAIANPGNVIRTGNGGGQLGHELAHSNEAPMNLSVAERFVRWFCPPDGLVGDPFCGSGTTAHAAMIHNRRFSGCDLRPEQVELTIRRMREIGAIDG